MPIFYVIMVFVVVGLVLWLINSYIPMEAGIKRLMNIAVIVLLVLWMLTWIFPGLWNVRVGSPRVGLIVGTMVLVPIVCAIRREMK